MVTRRILPRQHNSHSSNYGTVDPNSQQQECPFSFRWSPLKLFRLGNITIYVLEKRGKETGSG